jgi:hypothetical protein
MQHSISYRFELCFYNVVIHILSKSGRVRAIIHQVAALSQRGEWFVLAGSLLATSLAGLISGYILYFLFGGVG